MAHDECLKQSDIATLQEKVEGILTRLDKTEVKTDRNIDDIQELKQHKASNDQKFERVFELLGELKKSMDKIQKSIEKKNDRLPTLVYSVAGSS